MSLRLMENLYWFHILFAIIYYAYAQFNASDSIAYYARPQTAYESWFDAYQTGTPFIDFVSYPLINYLKFSYEMMMVLFAWMGYWGFVCFYLFFKENLKFTHKWQGYDLVTLLVFLPNMHFWTVSLGKGSIIFMALGMSIFGLSRMKKRKLTLAMGLLVLYHVRPHIFLFMALAILIGLVTGKEKVPLYQKIIVFGGTAVAVFLTYGEIMKFANIDTDNLLGSFDQFSSGRAAELAKAGSGIDISSYPLVFKFFTFWFRPLFVDSPGPIGIIVSFENLFYLYLTTMLFQSGLFKFFKNSSSLVKTSIVVFLATSFALSGTLSNMGIIIRQKSMVMYFLMFVVLSFIDYKKSSKVASSKLPAGKNRVNTLLTT